MKNVNVTSVRQGIRNRSDVSQCDKEDALESLGALTGFSDFTTREQARLALSGYLPAHIACDILDTATQ
jgi:hypothetical protein